MTKQELEAQLTRAKEIIGALVFEAPNIGGGYYTAIKEDVDLIELFPDLPNFMEDK